MKRIFSFSLLLFVVSLAHCAQARTVRLFVIGNSFSQNATRFLPQIAKAGGHELVIGRAELGGCSLQTHWSYVEANEAAPDDPKTKPYGGKSLHELLSKGTWDFVTLQQYSLLSPDVETYRPYAQKLRDFVKKLQPQAEVVLHQTWPYRSDSVGFGQISDKKNAKDQREMWEKSRAAYHAIADELGVRIIPNGDAFWRVDSDPQWGFKKDALFDVKNATPPALPDQTHSLNMGYSWKDGKLGFDSHHANDAGCYLGALVWYGFLFDEAPEKVTFAPPQVPAEFAAHLREVAAQILREAKAEQSKKAESTR